MSSWRRVDCKQQGCSCFRHEELLRDDGVYLGAVMQFIEGHASYPLGRVGRYGAYDTFDNAKSAVESMEK